MTLNSPSIVSGGTSEGTSDCWPVWNQTCVQQLGTALVGHCVSGNNLSQMIWSAWNEVYALQIRMDLINGTQTPVTIGHSSQCWAGWNAGAWGVPLLIPRRTPEEERAYQAQQREYQRLAEEKAAEDRRQRAEAKKKARALLDENLTEEQRKCFEAHGYFYQQIGGRRYKINLGRSGNVFEVDKHDKPITRFCIHPSMDVPDEDTVLAQKLLLLANEDEFRRVANQTRLS